ncbi:SDR family NAD(P)-dependent oxidoreductase [Biformimicrobium ophioploci]|uniref:Glucose 1-dehydrogenase n=1 Tax=Biformimicrobium ophioploci TaxID=3036711 RepID=A0ABQ6LVK4_9GAMM|nr:SDR family oxidoreductase [Microbulbifer sp. NKW57]GMG86126.1 glucose 1-dehydrogenase [Microbulbifer sp. NKW57]
MQDFTGRTVLITGASRGLGAEAARQFARANAHVIVAARRPEAGEAVVADIVSRGGRASFVRLDVTSQSDWHAAVAMIDQEFGALQVLVNNAGVHLARRMEQCTEADFYRQIETNLKGVFLGCQSTLPLLRKGVTASGDACIVNVSSIAGLVGVASQTLYNMTKGGVQLFSKSLALELADSKVRVNCVNPGMIENDMGEQLVGQLVEEGIFPEIEAASRFLHRQIPLRRFARCEEVARAITHLASPASSYLTGTEIVLDGGLTAG